MAEPATVPGARCKTSLASAYGLAADSYPAFSLPLSPLLSTLLIDINSDLSKFMEDQTVHGFLPVPGRRQRRYYGTSTSSFPGPYFERLMMSGSRALEFLASQGCTTLGNLVLSRRDALMADVRSTVPAEEVARLRYSPLPQSASIFPHALLDSALLKMRAAASDARAAHSPSAQDSSEACGVWSGQWVHDCSLGSGQLLWCCSDPEAVSLFVFLRSVWPGEEEGQGQGSLFLFLSRLRPLGR